MPPQAGSSCPQILITLAYSFIGCKTGLQAWAASHCLIHCCLNVVVCCAVLVLCWCVIRALSTALRAVLT